MGLKVYEYAKCSTCRNALKFLDAKKVKYEKVPIVENPPSLSELKKMLSFLKSQGKDIKNMLNTSGEVYRELKISEKLKSGISENEILKMLSENGKLIKRPFLLGDEFGLTGFKEEEWKKIKF